MIHQDRPAAFVTLGHRFAQHPSNHGAAPSAAAGPGADTRSPADLLEVLGARLDRLEYGASANLVAQTGRFEILDNRLLPGLLN